jgi:hypothetical protein
MGCGMIFMGCKSFLMPAIYIADQSQSIRLRKWHHTDQPLKIQIKDHVIHTMCLASLLHHLLRRHQAQTLLRSRLLSMPDAHCQRHG